MICKPIGVQDKVSYPYEFSVCTLVNNHQEYERMLDSFESAGFNEKNTEFLFIDNAKENVFDAYAGGNRFLSVARGQYIILCHQDVELLFDSITTLRLRLMELNELDSKWAICGNAGAAAPNYVVYNISYPDSGYLCKGSFPLRVNSLDENFLIIRRDSQVGFSSDLSGFHLYGTDICLQAQAKGHTAYVIGFNLLHKSRGIRDENYDLCELALKKKYSHLSRPRWIQTTISKFYISGTWLSGFLGNKLFLFFIRLFYSVKKKRNQNKIDM